MKLRISRPAPASSITASASSATTSAAHARAAAAGDRAASALLQRRRHAARGRERGHQAEQHAGDDRDARS
jgi:hypothetical protein